MTDVFLSYSSADRAAANAVQAALTRQGLDVFWDQEVPAGQDWDDWIRAKLTAARVCVVLWSKTSIASPNVRHEAMIARDAKKLVPAMIEALAPSDFPMGLYLVQTVQLQDWRNAGGPGMTRLSAEIAARLGRPSGSSAKAASPPAPRRGLMMAAAVAGLALIGVAAWQMSRSPGAVATTDEAPIHALPDIFSLQMVGGWRWNDAMACADGPQASIENGALIFTTPDSRYEHAIEADGAQETRTRVTAPEFALGEQYVFTPEFFETREARNFRLVVNNQTAGTRDVWTPCETP
ncbi:MAG: toll/interleukin-1 receptor domain-containing protein [Hyphomonadaceae bacterium]|nr:toll/interleukin-1 receptor domain-containing protein [Hyphomonadaceae bacterium]